MALMICSKGLRQQCQLVGQWKKGLDILDELNHANHYRRCQYVWRPTSCECDGPLPKRTEFPFDRRSGLKLGHPRLTGGPDETPLVKGKPCTRNSPLWWNSIRIAQNLTYLVDLEDVSKDLFGWHPYPELPWELSVRQKVRT